MALLRHHEASPACLLSRAERSCRKHRPRKRGVASGPAAAPRAGSPRSPGARQLGDVLASFGGRMRGEAAKGGGEEE